MNTIGSLFSGIGGLELGLESAGLGRVAWQVEIDPTCRQLLGLRWPDALRFDDVRTAHPPPVDVLCGGFPCQPVSLAGGRKAQSDERWLWPEFARLIDECAPGIVVCENVLGLRTAGLRDVLADLAARGFDAEWCDIGAFEVGAPHVRRRVFIVATHPDRISLRHKPGWLSGSCWSRAAVSRFTLEAGIAADPDGMRRLESAWRIATQRGWPEHSCGPLGAASAVDDGLPRGLVGWARKALGNAVVPQVAEAVGRAIVGGAE